MPGQIDVIRRHIDDALAGGGRAVLGGPDAVQPPYVQPTILVDVPEDVAAVREETFGPTLTVTRVADADEARRPCQRRRVRAGRRGLLGKARGMALARRLRSGMTSVNATLSFAGMPSLPFGGVGDSGFGRIHGDDGLREFTRPKAITRRRLPSPLPSHDLRPHPQGGNPDRQGREADPRPHPLTLPRERSVAQRMRQKRVISSRSMPRSVL